MTRRAGFASGALAAVSSPRRRSVAYAVAGAVLAGLAVSAAAGQLDTRTFSLLREGMSESEVLVRAGPPDLVTFPGEETVIRAPSAGPFDLYGHPRFVEAEIKQLHYIPAPGQHDPYLTVITIRAGAVRDLRRTKVFTRQPQFDQDEPAPGPRRESDSERRSRYAEEAVQAAEDYADTRERLLRRREQATGDPAAEPAPVYQTTQPDGTPYFGDRPYAWPEDR